MALEYSAVKDALMNVQRSVHSSQSAECYLRYGCAVAWSSCYVAHRVPARTAVPTVKSQSLVQPFALDMSIRALVRPRIDQTSAPAAWQQSKGSLERSVRPSKSHLYSESLPY